MAYAEISRGEGKVAKRGPKQLKGRPIIISFFFADVFKRLKKFYS